MARFMATRPLTVETDVVRRVGANGEDHGSTQREVTVPVGAELSPDLVIAASRHFVDDNGELVLCLNADGGVVDTDDPEADWFVETYATLLDHWVKDGSVVVVRE